MNEKEVGARLVRQVNAAMTYRVYATLILGELSNICFSPFLKRLIKSLDYTSRNLEGIRDSSLASFLGVSSISL